MVWQNFYTEKYNNWRNKKWGLFGLFGRKKEVELDDNITEGILQFENLNLKLAVIQVLMYDLNLLKPRFDIYGFADEHKELEINTDSYTVIEPALNFLENYLFQGNLHNM